MTGFRACVLATALTLSLLSPSCRLFHRSAKTKFTPPPPPAPTAPASKPDPQTSQTGAQIPAPPEIQPQAPNISQPPVGPGKLPPPPRRKTVRQPAAPPPAETAPASQPQPPAPPPQLEQVLTAEKQKAYNDEIDNHISHTQRTLAALGGRRLNGEQQTYLDRIRAFLKQAEEARKIDLFRARNLAQRASLLADDLVRSVQ
jgi:outer membrane biosynthesis protein TonB